jgi:hypothetical protein
VSQSASDRKLLVISVDGLSRYELPALSSFVDWAKELRENVRLVPADEQPLVSLQSAWAEILTGLPWYVVDCPGYRRPAPSLNECEVMTEDRLLSTISLVPDDRQGSSLVINMPLIQPRSPSRLWLADGSLPTQCTVDPPALMLDSPFKDYKARPFSSTARALLNLSDSVNACIQNETLRLQCALNLIEKSNWRVCFLRITFFDLLHHLLGEDYLRDPQRIVWAPIRDFLAQFDKAMQRIASLCPAVYTCVVSTFHHIPCRARLNINQMLSDLGFCHFQALSHASEPVLARRREASLLLARTKKERTNWGQLSLPSNKSFNFDLIHTSAASPISGTIYVNRSSRFSGGIVSDQDAASTLAEVRASLTFLLNKEFSNGSYITTPGGCAEMKAPVSSLSLRPDNPMLGHRQGPDLTVSIPGVELHNSTQPAAIDHENHPCSTHEYTGFAWVSGSVPAPNNEVSTVALHRHLMEKLR